MENPIMRELFIDELAQVTGGAGPDPIERIKELIGGGETTMACCEEGQCCDYWS